MINIIPYIRFPVACHRKDQSRIKGRGFLLSLRLAQLILAGISLFSILLFTPYADVHAGNNGGQQDLSQHPTYKNYHFDQSPKVIHIGSQPLLSPTGFISEAMKRDRVLHNALQEMGLSIQFYPFLKGADINFFLKSGKLDAGIAGDMPTISFVATSDGIAIIPIQYGSVSLVTRRPVFLGELKGKKIGYARGSNAHFLLLSLLSAAELKEDEVTLVSMNVDSMVKALQEEKIFAFSSWEPIPEIALRRHGYVSTFKKLSVGFLYFTQSFANDNAEAIKVILAAELRAINWIKTSRKNLLTASKWSLEISEELTGEKIPLSTEENAAVAKQDILWSSSVRKNYQNILASGQLESQYNFLKGINKITSEKSWEQVEKGFDTSMLLEVIKNPQQYKQEQYDYNFLQPGKP
jgi:sulfonate transport system substrate-binding protein